MSLLLLSSCLLVCFAATLWFGTPSLKPGLVQMVNKLRLPGKEGLGKKTIN